MIKQSLYDHYNNKKMVQSTHLLSNMAQYKEKTTKANSRLYMGQFLQGGKNGRLMSFFFKSRANFKVP